MSDDLQLRVEQIVEKCLPKYLRERRTSHRPEPEELNVTMEKEFQKNKLLNSIIYQFHELMDSKVSVINETVRMQSYQQLNQRMDQLQRDLDQIKERMVKSWQEMSTVRPNMSRSTVQILDLDQSSNDSFMGEDRTIRDIMKKIKDVEDSTRRKIQSTENHITLLMESQIQLKAEVQEVTQQKRPQKDNSGVNPAKIQETIQMNLMTKIDEAIEKKYLSIKDIMTENQNKEKEKQKYYWTLVSDLTEKLDKVKKDVEDLMPQKKPEEKQSSGGPLGYIRRSIYRA